MHCAIETVLDIDYYTVQPIGHWALTPLHEHGICDEMQEWCVTVFGPIIKSDPRWFMKNLRFFFKEEKDREWFVLRWT